MGEERIKAKRTATGDNLIEKMKDEFMRKVLWDLSFIVASLYEVMNNLINHQQASPVILKEVKENIIKLQNKLRGKEE